VPPATCNHHARCNNAKNDDILPRTMEGNKRRRCQARRKKKTQPQGCKKTFTIPRYHWPLRNNPHKLQRNVKKRENDPHSTVDATNTSSHGTFLNTVKCCIHVDPTGQSRTAGSSPCMCHVAISCYRRRALQEG
jgi:hypothetical protein